MNIYFSLNPTDEEVETIKKEIDEDGSGEIDFTEFLEIMNCKTLRLSICRQILLVICHWLTFSDECRRWMTGRAESGIHSRDWRMHLEG